MNLSTIGGFDETTAEELILVRAASLSCSAAKGGWILTYYGNCLRCWMRRSASLGRN